MFFDFRQTVSRIHRCFLYSGAVEDDGLAYPTADNPQQYYGPSVFDAPNRFSLSFNYSLKGLNGGKGAVGVLTGGWGISGTSIFQSGYPLTASNFNSYNPVCADTSSTAPACPSFRITRLGTRQGSGDYNADGNDNGSPNATSYSQSTNNKSWLNGVFQRLTLAFHPSVKAGMKSPQAIPRTELHRDQRQFLQGHGGHGKSQLPVPV